MNGTAGNEARRTALREALQRVAAGDRDSLNTVYDATCDKMFGICLRITRDREIAEDVLQDMFVKVWRRAGRFDADKGSPITWLATIARNSSIDAMRRCHPVAPGGEEDLAQVADDSPAADDIMLGEERDARIHECLDALDEQQRDCIREAFFDGSTHRMLAERRKVPLGTLKSWIRRGLARLKECLGG